MVVGESTVGEFSLSSLKLKLFLLSDSAPVGERERRQSSDKLDEVSAHFSTYRNNTHKSE